jgi:DNA repair protein SbcC/Rad50
LYYFAMEILSVSLKNFKSHGDRCFHFQPGTNAICGENGAGKTSILEAIAWVMFDYIGDYTKDDLVRNGAASAQVRVVFVSNRDGRTYDVQRCTSKSYTLFDPQLGERLPYTRIKEEVLPWLRQQFGVAPGTDLSQLFGSTIGVPQGTFTADFLLTKEKRKPIFDKILKVEEYQQTWKRLGDLEKYSKTQIEGLERELAHHDEVLTQWEEIHAKQQAKQQDIHQVKTALEQATQQIATLEQEQASLALQATRSQQLDSELLHLSTQQQTQSKTLERLQVDLQQAEVAVAICTEHRPSFQAFQAAEAALAELEQQRHHEHALQQQRRSQETALGQHQAQLTALMLHRDRLASAKQDIARLQPLAAQQTALEQRQKLLTQHQQACHSARQTHAHETKRLQQLSQRHSQIQHTLTQLQQLVASVGRIPLLEQQQQRLQQQLSRIAAATQFEADLRQLLQQIEQAQGDYRQQMQQVEVIIHEIQRALPSQPVEIARVSQVLQSAVGHQQAIATGLHEILQDLSPQTNREHLEAELDQAQTQLEQARHNQLKLATQDRLFVEQAQLAADIADLEAQLYALKATWEREPDLATELAELADALRQLDNPHGRLQLRQEELAKEAELQAQIAQAEAALAELQRAIAQIDQHLAPFADLGEQMQAQQTQRDSHRPAYEQYMLYRELANCRKGRQQAVQEVTQELDTLGQTQANLQLERDRLHETFDPQQFQTVQAAYHQAKTESAALSARLPDMQTLLAELDHQIARLQETQTKRQTCQTQLEQAKKRDRFIKFARKTYKEAGPRITERYLHSISREADKLFRELLNRSNVSLTWTRDYEILVQEGAHSRRLLNLSGGEQMCAALAVRLALLKVLADIDIAFFDEPTTNMDRPRRTQLAGAIANLKSLRQLFVISHDDTFETITENVIVVERDE